MKIVAGANTFQQMSLHISHSWYRLEIRVKRRGIMKNGYLNKCFIIVVCMWNSNKDFSWFILRKQWQACCGIT